jgi:hypothetical protein
MGKRDLNRVASAATKYQQAREALDDAIRAAAEAGETARAISDATGTAEKPRKGVTSERPVLSHGQVYNLAAAEFAKSQRASPKRRTRRG